MFKNTKDEYEVIDSSDSEEESKEKAKDEMTVQELIEYEEKMEKIKKEQIPLLRSAPAVSALEQIGLSTEQIDHQVCYKAQLFHPYGINKVHIRPLNKDCLVGFWLKFEEVAATSGLRVGKRDWVRAVEKFKLTLKKNYYLIKKINIL